MPRFGHSSNMADLVASGSEMEDYINGTLFVAGFILFFLLLWFIIQIFLVCLSKRGGEKVMSPKKKNWLRGTFLLSGFAGILGTILYITIGLPIAQDTVDNAQIALTYVQSFLTRADGLLDALSVIGYNATSLRNDIRSDLNEFCDDYESANAALGVDLEAIVDAMVKSLDLLSDFSLQSIAPVNDGINDAMDGTYEVEDNLENADHIFDIITYILVTIIVLMFFPSVVVAMEAKGIEVSWFRSLAVYVLSPMLALVLLVTTIIVAVVSVIAVINAGE